MIDMTACCGCTCGLPGCASRPGRRFGRAGITVHGVASGYDRGCRCRECTAANTKSKQARRARRNAETRDRAVQHGSRWTVEEIATTARTDLTDYEVALLIGRTLLSVKAARRRRGITAR